MTPASRHCPPSRGRTRAAHNRGHGSEAFDAANADTPANPQRHGALCAPARLLIVPAPSFRGTVAALALGQLMCWAALYYGFSSFVLPMQRDTGWSSPQLMGAYTLGLALWGATSYAVGAAIDRGHGRWVLSAGAALAGIGCFLWARATSLPALYGSWAVLGLAMAMCLYDPAFSVLTRRFPDRYASGIAVLTLVGGFASTLSFPLAVVLIAQSGWRGALDWIGAALLLGVAPLHAWTLRGQTAQGVRPSNQGASVANEATLHEAMRGRPFWLLTTALTFYALASAAVWAHMMPAFAAKGLSEREALAVVVWFGPAQVFGRLIYLAFGRRMSTHTLGLLVLCGMPVSLLIFARFEQAFALSLFALLFGLANGLVTIVRGKIVPETFGHANVGRIGGAMSGIALLARAAAPLAAAWLLLVVAGYAELMLWLAALGLVALLAFALAVRRPSRPDQSL